MEPKDPVIWLGERSEYRTTDFDGRLRRCHLLGRLTPETADGAEASGLPVLFHWVRLDPALVLGGEEFEEVLLRPRHVGGDIDALGDTNISVYVGTIRSKDGFDRGRVRQGAFDLLAWADVARDPAFLPPTQEEGFDRIFDVLRRYAGREGESNVPPEHEEDGLSLGNWVLNMKRSQARGELRADWADRLEALPGWRWGVDADRAWASAWSLLGTLWLMPAEGSEAVGLDRRLRIGEPIGLKGPVDDPEGRPTAKVYIYPPLRIEVDEPGVLVLVSRTPAVDLRAFEVGTVIVEASHIRSWRREADGTRRPDEITKLGLAVVARDPALLPAMSDEAWRDGLAALRGYRAAIGHCWVPFDYVPNGDHASNIHLGGWALRVRSEHRQGTLPAERARELESVDEWHWSWTED
jgi:hypothetical protein